MLSRNGDAVAGRLSEGTLWKVSSVADLSTGDDKMAPAVEGLSVEGLSLVALSAAVGRFSVCELLLVRPCALLPATAGTTAVGEVTRGGSEAIGDLMTVATLLMLSLAECPTTARVLVASAPTGPGIISTRSMK